MYLLKLVPLKKQGKFVKESYPYFNELRVADFYNDGLDFFILILMGVILFVEV